MTNTFQIWILLRTLKILKNPKKFKIIMIQEAPRTHLKKLIIPNHTNKNLNTMKKSLWIHKLF